MPRPTVTRTPYGTLPGGEETELWALDSGHGVRAEILTYGAVLHSLTVPDTRGEDTSVVLALPGIGDYAEKNAYVGAVVGRFANRIANGTFTLDGTRYHVPANDRGHALHGGPGGFDTKVWRAEEVPGDKTAAVRLSLHSPDGDMGFPGALDVSVTYSIDAEGTLAVDFTATTDRPTVVNLAHHAYFDLTGEGDIRGHTLQVDAESYLPVDGTGIPEGPAADVRGTAFDLTEPRVLGERLTMPDEQLRAAGGFDHCWVLDPAGPAAAPRRAARLSAPGGLRVMEVWTTEPGVQVYTANQLDGSLAAPSGRRHERYSGVCLETQHLPDSPNRPEYPTTVVRPQEPWHSRTEFRFPHLTAKSPGEDVENGASRSTQG
ncbi:aldose epimerase family protein [Streptomyces pristinaespiralis]|uniref:Aldose 1-epimerase n=2 Tax=Streptomyces pristinaespiralis TaxID=38300 RepID=B5H6P1_STRE2|nr:aldose epimerase family protein [Streptomyces pristinaespiralis]ALC18672.1 aldose 1-epimerase [Streptomyces pristinaespiralis]EDY62502.1 aldose 1-epimerase [Streptomyces pristinaespiralis ATCC 25486]QMU18159.1 galactose mutarotase [Streptomyces pristinaespiralis]